jgi:hypothetical protein
MACLLISVMAYNFEPPADLATKHLIYNNQGIMGYSFDLIFSPTTPFKKFKHIEFHVWLSDMWRV